METKVAQIKTSHFERKLLLFLTFVFIAIMVTAWAFSMNLRKSIVGTNSAAKADVEALVDVERIRNLANAQLSTSLDFFLLGSANLFDEQKESKKAIAQALIQFEKNHSIAEIPALIKTIETLEQQQQEFFDQGMAFRAKQTESKIIGQFYRSKVAPIKTGINKALDDISKAHRAEFERAQTATEKAARDIETQIPEALVILTGVLAFIFSSMSILVIRFLRQRSNHFAERTRLYNAAQDAVHVSDGMRSAVSYDFVEPLHGITQALALMKRSLDATTFSTGVQIIATSVAIMEDRIKDIMDQAKADQGHLNLRVEQTPIDTVLDQAQLILEPLAKQNDIRLEFNPVNPPVLAFIDRERVVRVLTNLVGNAIKFSPKHSKIIVKVRSDQQFVYVSVKDSGPGIPEKHLPEVFDNFWQSRKNAKQGPGIGLGVVKSIIEAHRGVVTVESYIGRGSTFTFSLPRRRPTGALVRKPAPAVVKIAQPQSHPSQLV